MFALQIYYDRQVRPLLRDDRCAALGLPRHLHALTIKDAPMHPAYDELTRIWARTYRLNHLLAIASWDRAAKMPSKGNKARADAIAEMDALLHRLRVDPALQGLLERAEDEGLDGTERANLREMRRDW